MILISSCHAMQTVFAKFAEPANQMLSSFFKSFVCIRLQVSGLRAPLVVADLYRTVVVSFGGGVVGIYDSLMPIAEPKSVHVTVTVTHPSCGQSSPLADLTMGMSPLSYSHFHLELPFYTRLALMHMCPGGFRPGHALSSSS